VRLGDLCVRLKQQRPVSPALTLLLSIADRDLAFQDFTVVLGPSMLRVVPLGTLRMVPLGDGAYSRASSCLALASLRPIIRFFRALSLSIISTPSR
jgi:hypothetical protein